MYKVSEILNNMDIKKAVEDIKFYLPDLDDFRSEEVKFSITIFHKIKDGDFNDTVELKFNGKGQITEARQYLNIPATSNDVISPSVVSFTRDELKVYVNVWSIEHMVKTIYLTNKEQQRVIKDYITCAIACNKDNLEKTKEAKYLV